MPMMRPLALAVLAAVSLAACDGAGGNQGTGREEENAASNRPDSMVTGTDVTPVPPLDSTAGQSPPSAVGSSPDSAQNDTARE